MILAFRVVVEMLCCTTPICRRRLRRCDLPNIVMKTVRMSPTGLYPRHDKFAALSADRSCAEDVSDIAWRIENYKGRATLFHASHTSASYSQLGYGHLRASCHWPNDDIHLARSDYRAA